MKVAKLISANLLNQQYLKWYQEQISFRNINDHVVQIDSPFLDNFRDEIAIYAIEQPDDNIKLTDDGWTLDNLESQGVALNRSKAKKKILAQQMKYYGILIDDGELSIIINKERFPEAKHRLLQAILFVNNMFMLSSTNNSSIFLEDLASFFESHNIRATAGVSFIGNSGLTHKFDFLIAGFKTIPTRLIKTLSVSQNAVVFAKSILTDITQTRLIRESLTNYYVFINDVNKEHQIVNVSSDILSLFEQNNIKAIKYSQREKVVKELAE